MIDIAAQLNAIRSQKTAGKPRWTESELNDAVMSAWLHTIENSTEEISSENQSRLLNVAHKMGLQNLEDASSQAHCAAIRQHLATKNLPTKLVQAVVAAFTGDAPIDLGATPSKVPIAAAAPGNRLMDLMMSR